VIACYNPIIAEAIEAALKKRKITAAKVDFEKFDPSKLQSSKVGILSIQEFAKVFKKIEADNNLGIVQGQMSQIYDALIFAEIHWKVDITRQIEKLLYQKQGEDAAMKNIYYVSSKNTVDEYLYEMLYQQDFSLFEALEVEKVAAIRVAKGDPRS